MSCTGQASAASDQVEEVEEGPESVCAAVGIQIAGAGPEASSCGGKQEGDPTGMQSGHMSSSASDGEQYAYIFHEERALKNSNRQYSALCSA
ncbi:uncharacterized [Tachysurus ichikawai]